MNSQGRVLSLVLLVALTLQGISAVTEKTCPGAVTVSEDLHVDVFTEVLSNHPDQARNLKDAPLIGNIDPKAPAYEFRGSGIHLPDQYLSDTIRAHSCLTNEITLFGSVFFKRANAAGPIIELSYADSFGPSLPVFSLRLDALADEIIVAYRHLGNLHTEVFSVRLHNHKWRSYGVTLSGNQALVYDDCELRHTRIIPLPDYCANDSSLIISVADSTVQEPGQNPQNQMFAFLQNVGVHFGQQGIQQLCPEVSETCVTCGRYLKLVERVYQLKQEINSLKSQVRELETREPARGCPTAGAQCSRTVDGETFSFANGTFRSFPDQTLCYCLDGYEQCTQSNSVCLNETVAVNTGGGEQSDSVSTTDSEPPATPVVEQFCFRGDGSTIPLNKTDSRFLNNQCLIEICLLHPLFGAPYVSATPYNCMDSGYELCLRNFTTLERNISTCCSLCSVCSFMDCQENSRCESYGDHGECVCLDGYRQDESSGSCVDIDECSEEGYSCPADSTCRNTNGGFVCDCNEGFNEVVSASSRTCEDDNECEDPARANCTGQGVMCVNLPGSFECRCRNDNSTVPPSGNCENRCDPPCQNGGTCGGNRMCQCHRGYTGRECEEDIDECATGLSNCDDTNAMCINTMGSFFCRCKAGYNWNGTSCLDIDECDLDFDNCPSDAMCVNRIGSFTCLCNEKDDCTGSCSFNHRGVSYNLDNGDSMIVPRCRNCTCLDGDIACVRTTCDCSTEPPRDCCPACYRRDCEVNGIRIRPNQIWVNPSDRCERIICEEKKGELVPREMSRNCPVLDCPGNRTIQPMGKCCPICLLQPCTLRNNRQSVNLMNSCETCVCENSQWSCNKRMTCPAINCTPENILFTENGCCPVCASEALSVIGESCETG